jgi:hypothetical protein
MRDMQRISGMTSDTIVPASVKGKMIANCQSHVDEMIRLAVSEFQEPGPFDAELAPKCITAAMIQRAGMKMPDGMDKFILGYSGDSTWKMFVRVVLNQIHPSAHITPRMLQVMNDYAIYTCKLLVDHMKKNASFDEGGMMTHHHVLEAINGIFVGELARHAQSEAIKAVHNFHDTPENSSHLPGKICFPSELISPLVRSLWPETPVIDADAAVSIAATLEYMCAEILELSGNCMTDLVHPSVNPYNMAIALGMDDELKKTYPNVLIPYGFSCELVEKSATTLTPLVPSPDDMFDPRKMFRTKAFNADVMIPRLSFMHFVLGRLEALNKDLAQKDPEHTNFSISDEAMDALQFLIESISLQSAVDRFK